MALIGVYEHTRVELLRDVFVWAYERSCRRYKTVRDSLPEPDRFRLKYRDALIEVVGEIIRRGLKPTTEEIDALAVPLVLPEDLEQFRDLVPVEIARLHEGNIARFRLRPNEFRRVAIAITRKVARRSNGGTPRPRRLSSNPVPDTSQEVASLRGESSNQLFETLEEWNDYLER